MATTDSNTGVGPESESEADSGAADANRLATPLGQVRRRLSAIGLEASADTFLTTSYLAEAATDTNCPDFAGSLRRICSGGCIPHRLRSYARGEPWNLGEGDPANDNATSCRVHTPRR